MVGAIYLLVIVMLFSVWLLSIQRRRRRIKEIESLGLCLRTDLQELASLVEALARKRNDGQRNGAFEDSVAYYEANLQNLLKKHEGAFIAIIDGQVVDSDADFSALAKRVYQRFGYKDIFMPKVERKPASVRLPSPRLERG